MNSLLFELIISALLLVVLFLIVYNFFFSPKSQTLGRVIYRGNQTNEKVIALTFDDGPNEPFTSQILQILQKYQIKATFFPVGENIDRNREVLKKISIEGHVIGNHSYSHAFFAPILSLTYKEEMARSQDLILDITGKKPQFFRPPWFLRTVAMLKTAQKLELITITGTFASYFEVFKVSPQKIARDAIKHTRPGVILVFHDGYNNKGTSRTKTVEALKIVIPELVKSGYKFVTVPELLKMGK